MRISNIFVGVGSLLMAGSLLASELTAEYRDTEGGSQWKAEFAQTITKKNKVNIGGEIETRQSNNGSMDSTVTAIAGYNVKCDGCGKWSLQPFTQVGEALRSKNLNSDFYGYGLKATRTLTDKNSFQLGYRLRTAYDGVDFNENRLSAAFDHRFSKNHSIGVAAYTYWGTQSDNRFGVFYKYYQ